MTRLSWEPQISARAILPLIVGLDALGYSSNKILKAAGVSFGRNENLDARFTRAAVGRLWEIALDETGDKSLGINLALAAPIESFELHAYAMLSSDCLREAYRRACRYQRLIHEVNNLNFDEGDGYGILSHILPGGRPAARHPAEFLATLWVRFGKLIVDDSWFPDFVSFAHAQPASIEAHHAALGPHIMFGALRTSIKVSDEALNKPNTRADAGLSLLTQRYADSLLRVTPVRATFSDRVRTSLSRCLQDGKPQAERVAKDLCMSTRSLHRGLKSDGTTFYVLLDQLRAEQASTLLSDLRWSIEDITFLLGFAEVSSFYRACRRWTGRTPVALRHEFAREYTPRQSAG